MEESTELPTADTTAIGKHRASEYRGSSCYLQAGAVSLAGRVNHVAANLIIAAGSLYGGDRQHIQYARSIRFNTY